MTSDRAQAYGRVVRLIEDAGPAKLLPEERQAIRETADTLLFCDGPHCAEDVRAAVAEVERLADRLVEAERWSRANAALLLREVEACGPVELAGL